MMVMFKKSFAARNLLILAVVPCLLAVATEIEADIVELKVMS